MGLSYDLDVGEIPTIWDPWDLEAQVARSVALVRD